MTVGPGIVMQSNWAALQTKMKGKGRKAPRPEKRVEPEASGSRQDARVTKKRKTKHARRRANDDDATTAASALADCGPVCDASPECAGFNFVASPPRCYYRRSTTCYRAEAADRTCFVRRPEVCSSGILSPNGQACCPRSCGSCGGQGCDRRAGGARNCCQQNIMSSGTACQTPEQTSCIVPAPPPSPLPPPAAPPAAPTPPPTYTYGVLGGMSCGYLWFQPRLSPGFDGLDCCEDPWRPMAPPSRDDAWAAARDRPATTHRGEAEHAEHATEEDDGAAQCLWRRDALAEEHALPSVGEAIEVGAGGGRMVRVPIAPLNGIDTFEKVLRSARSIYK